MKRLRTHHATRIARASGILHELADARLDLALDILAARADAIDGYPTGSGGERVTASAELTPTEAAAEARLKASLWRADMLAAVHLLAVTADDLAATVARVLAQASEPMPSPALCSSHGLAGAIEWGDPLCRDAAAKAGLCERCYQRARRWRSTHGLTPLGDVA